MQSARESGKPAPSLAPYLIACSWYPQASRRNLGAKPLTPTSTLYGNMRSLLSTTFSKLGCSRESPGVGGGGLRPLLVILEKTLLLGDLPLVLFQKQNMFCRRQAPLIAGRESYGQLLPPLGSHIKRSHPEGAGRRGARAEHSASSGTVPLGSSRSRQ